jgi:hypothetical protein
MSDTIRIALVGEGITDYLVLQAAIESMLNGRSFDLKLLQPEESVAFTGGGDAGLLGGGWKGVYKWCGQSAIRGDGHLRNDPLFISYDLLILQLDAEVAGEKLDGQLPCEQPCPPPNASTDPLRQVMLAWAGENETPPRTVLCTPSKNMEAWVMAIFFPDDREMRRLGWECHPNPEGRLANQKKRDRFPKSQLAYEKRKPQFQAGWPSIATSLSEAARFENDFHAALQGLPV